MTQEAEEILDQFFSHFAAASRALLVLDYDGTLAPFRIDRFTARPWAGVREILNLIQNEKRTRLAIVTGRPPREIQPLLDLAEPVEVWGLHGAERLYPDGHSDLEQQQPAVRDKLNELTGLLNRDAFGGLFEPKPNAVVMHWRGIAPQNAREVEARTRALFEPAAQVEGLRLLEFERGLELRAGRDKGGAVSSLLDEMKVSAADKSPAAYLGDDLTDEAAFKAMNAAEGPHLSALVRRRLRETEAKVWLKPPGELCAFLNRWLAATRLA
ncbi:MAG TPA: trehalose-phosphatase [Terracidiphilus sp.]|nr:trehalose-phosphatase [Terracidiphilus sp.]